MQLQQSEISKIVSNNRQGKTTQSPRCSSDQQIVSFIVNFASSLEIYSPGLTIRETVNQKAKDKIKTTLILIKRHPPTWKRIAKDGVASSATLSFTVSYSDFNFIHKI